PVLCATLLGTRTEAAHGRLYRISERFFDGMHGFYSRTLTWVLRHPHAMLGVTILTTAVNVYLFVVVPKGFFPQQDTGRLTGIVQAAQDISFQAMWQKLAAVAAVLGRDPAGGSRLGF